MKWLRCSINVLCLLLIGGIHSEYLTSDGDIIQSALTLKRSSDVVDVQNHAGGLTVEAQDGPPITAIFSHNIVPSTNQRAEQNKRNELERNRNRAGKFYLDELNRKQFRFHVGNAKLEKQFDNSLYRFGRNGRHFVHKRNKRESGTTESQVVIPTPMFAPRTNYMYNNDYTNYQPNLPVGLYRLQHIPQIADKNQYSPFNLNTYPVFNNPYFTPETAQNIYHPVVDYRFNRFQPVGPQYLGNHPNQLQDANQQKTQNQYGNQNFPTIQNKYLNYYPYQPPNYYPTYGTNPMPSYFEQRVGNEEMKLEHLRNVLPRGDVLSNVDVGPTRHGNAQPQPNMAQKPEEMQHLSARPNEKFGNMDQNDKEIENIAVTSQYDVSDINLTNNKKGGIEISESKARLDERLMSEVGGKVQLECLLIEDKKDLPTNGNQNKEGNALIPNGNDKKFRMVNIQEETKGPSVSDHEFATEHFDSNLMGQIINNAKNDATMQSDLGNTEEMANSKTTEYEFINGQFVPNTLTTLSTARNQNENENSIPITGTSESGDFVNGQYIFTRPTIGGSESKTSDISTAKDASTETDVLSSQGPTPCSPLNTNRPDARTATPTNMSNEPENITSDVIKGIAPSDSLSNSQRSGRNNSKQGSNSSKSKGNLRSDGNANDGVTEGSGEKTSPLTIPLLDIPGVLSPSTINTELPLFSRDNTPSFNLEKTISNRLEKLHDDALIRLDKLRDQLAPKRDQLLPVGPLRDSNINLSTIPEIADETPGIMRNTDDEILRNNNPTGLISTPTLAQRLDTLQSKLAENIPPTTSIGTESLAPTKTRTEILERLRNEAKMRLDEIRSLIPTTGNLVGDTDGTTSNENDPTFNTVQGRTEPSGIDMMGEKVKGLNTAARTAEVSTDEEPNTARSTTTCDNGTDATSNSEKQRSQTDKSTLDNSDSSDTSNHENFDANITEENLVLSSFVPQANKDVSNNYSPTGTNFESTENPVNGLSEKTKIRAATGINAREDTLEETASICHRYTNKVLGVELNEQASGKNKIALLLKEEYREHLLNRVNEEIEKDRQKQKGNIPTAGSAENIDVELCDKTDVKLVLVEKILSLLSEWVADDVQKESKGDVSKI